MRRRSYVRIGDGVGYGRWRTAPYVDGVISFTPRFPHVPPIGHDVKTHVRPRNDSFFASDLGQTTDICIVASGGSFYRRAPRGSWYIA